MTQPHAPRDILKLASCGCKTGCTSRQCSCKRESLACTDLCKCQRCSNPLNSTDEPSEADEMQPETAATATPALEDTACPSSADESESDHQPSGSDSEASDDDEMV
eukprot:scpid93812/ scgid30702/ 